LLIIIFIIVHKDTVLTMAKVRFEYQLFISFCLFSVPAKINTLRKYAVYSTAITLKWDKVREGVARKTYTVNWNSVSETDHITGISGNSITIRDLYPSTEYSFKVAAINEAGASLESIPLRILTSE